MLPKRFDGLRLRLHVGWLAQHAFFIQAGAVLAVAQGAVGAGGGVPQIFAFWQYAQRIGTLKQGDVATVLKHGGVLVAVQQNQILGDEFGIYHAARAVLEVELPVSHLVGAAYALAHGEKDAALLASHAKLACGEAAWLAARKGIQVHGGMGYTWEVDLQMFMKRAWALNSIWGDNAFHRQRMGELLLAAGAPVGPGTSF